LTVAVTQIQRAAAKRPPLFFAREAAILANVWGAHMEFPNDADGDALRRVLKSGSDLSRPMVIDFLVDVPGPEVGEAVAHAAMKLGYQTKVGYDDEDAAWTCCCTREMIASYAGVVSRQAELNLIAEPLGAFCDGWGTFGNAGECE
jgi:regulator of RNase E activity RraB